MMVINFLQVQEPPVLPPLQTGEHDPILVEGADIWFNKSLTFTSANQASIGALLIYFFYHYSVIVPSLPNIFGNVAEGSLQVTSNHPYLYSVIDPFEKRQLINVNRDSVQAE
jgi:DNA polymerase sigma